MSLRLSPRIYRQNFKWSVLPRNKIDTVIAKPVLNTPLSDVVTHTQEVTSVNIGDEAHTLPIGLNVPVNRFGSSNNYVPGQSTTLCIGQVGCVVATGSVLFTLSKPLPSVPTARVRCEGTTHFTNRGALSHDDVAKVYTQSANDVASWIHSHASGNEDWIDKSTDAINRGAFEDPTLVDYTGQSVPLYAWARKIVPANDYDANVELNLPEEQDILTSWYASGALSPDARLCARTANWTGYGSADSVEMWPPDISVPELVLDLKAAISLRKLDVPITAQVKKLDDYTYQVDYSVPVRYEYVASSQYYKTSYTGKKTFYDLDNYCFLDRINKLKIELVAQELSEETEDVSYSLVDGYLSEKVANEHPLNFEQNELITSEAFWGANKSNPWTLVMSQYILKKFKDGKYVVECEVPAAWALQNDVHINSVFEVQLQDGTMISRNDTVSLFEVKNIEKLFRNDSFIFSLRLMEV